LYAFVPCSKVNQCRRPAEALRCRQFPERIKQDISLTTSTQLSSESDETNGLEYWRNPAGVSVAFDSLKFLYIPDHVESRMVADLALKVFAWQKRHRATGDQITRAVMVTMGGMLPGVLLHDHLAWHPDPDIPPVEFGTLGVKYYAGPGKPLERPIIVQNMTINVRNQVV